VTLAIPLRFPYLEVDPSLGTASAMPYLPIKLQLGDRSISVSALVDSGATLNVLPFNVGLQLGAVWEAQKIPVRLSGNLSETEARGLVLTGCVAGCAPVRLVFAWSQSNSIPTILGQTNFFMEHDVRFCRSIGYFEITPQGAASA
jgi:hypothetical protein